MILSFTFYKLEGKPSISLDFDNNNLNFEKFFLQNVIKKHPLWSTTDFWEAAIFISIKEELKNQKNYLLDHEESSSDTIFRERNIVFGQLASYCNNMLMFDFEKQCVKEIIAGFCKLFNLLETQTKDLFVIFFFKLNIPQLYI